MSHLKSIAFLSEEETLQRLRERLSLMSDEELIKFGKQVRALAEPRIGVTHDLASAITDGAGGVETQASEVT